MRKPIFPYLSIANPVDLQSEDKAIASEWEQTKQNQQEIISVLLCKSKNLGLDLGDHEVQSVDIDHDDSFYMLTYRLAAIMRHVDGSVYPIKTNLEIATIKDAFEITASWFNAHIEVIDNVKRVVCDRHDGRIIFDLDIA